MDPASFRDVFAYNAWANRRVWDCLAALTDAQFDQPLDYSVGALRTQVLHTLAVEWWWVHFLQTGEIRFVDHAAYPDRDAIRAKWDETEAQTLAYLSGLTAAELDRLVRPDHWGADTPAISVRDALFQVINHSTDHRAQTLAGIHGLGGITVAQDYLSWWTEQQAEIADPG